MGKLDRTYYTTDITVRVFLRRQWDGSSKLEGEGRNKLLVIDLQAIIGVLEVTLHRIGEGSMIVRV